MNIIERDSFYASDTHKYQIKNNQELTEWLEACEANGYYNPLTNENLQELVDEIAKWYELKYQERDFLYGEKSINLNSDEKNKILNEMNINQLLNRLSDDKLNLIKSGYRSRMWTLNTDSNNTDKRVQSDIVINKIIDDKYLDEKEYFVISADYNTGKVLNAKNFKEIIDKEDLTLEELLQTLINKYPNKYDLSELLCCIYNHKCDLYLRDEIIQLVALKLLYSKETTPEKGYERAKNFISEFNMQLGTTLSTKEIETIINNSYSISNQNIRNKSLKK